MVQLAGPAGRASFEERIFTVDEAAEFARVSPETIRRWFDEGLRHMPTVKNVASRGPRREIVRLSALLSFIESREVGAREAASPDPGRAAARPGKSRAAPTPPPDDPLGFMTPRNRRKG